MPLSGTNLLHRQTPKVLETVSLEDDALMHPHTDPGFDGTVTPTCGANERAAPCRRGILH